MANHISVPYHGILKNLSQRNHGGARRLYWQMLSGWDPGGIDYAALGIPHTCWRQLRQGSIFTYKGHIQVHLNVFGNSYTISRRTGAADVSNREIIVVLHLSVAINCTNGIGVCVITM